MPTECIHGFEAGLCDTCFPKAVPEKPKAVRSSSPPRKAGASRPGEKPIAIADQRIYHVTHIDNLPGILDAGGLVADTRPAVDVSSPLARELRATAEAMPGIAVSEYVPFYLAPDATVWESLRSATPDPRWSPAALAANPLEFIFLISTARTLADDSVIADGDAAGTYTRFAGTAEDRDGMLRRLHNDEDAKLAAEALVKGSFAFDDVHLVGVANEPLRDRVKQLLDDASFSPRVVVYPPWFQPA